jgi:hypothetical protein
MQLFEVEGALHPILSPRNRAKGMTMTTADTVRERAMFLAVSGAENDEAVQELQASCEGRRVAVVRARQMMAASLDDQPAEPATQRAILLLDELLARLPA